MDNPRKRLFLLAVAAALAAPTSALALHRCTTKEGKVTYTDEPCADGAKASGVAIHDSSGMDVNKRTNTFEYKGATAVRSGTRSTPAPTPVASNEEAARKARCRNAQQNNKVLNTPAPVVAVTGKDRGKYIDDSQRDTAIKQQQQVIKSDC
jgi:hypothetical protein